MRYTRRAFIGALVALLTPIGARSHEGGLDARGTVVEVTGDTLVVETQKRDRHRFAVTERTEVRRGSARVKIGDIRPGERVVVHARRSPAGAEAISIRLSRGAK